MTSVDIREESNMKRPRRLPGPLGNKAELRGYLCDELSAEGGIIVLSVVAPVDGAVGAGSVGLEVLVLS